MSTQPACAAAKEEMGETLEFCTELPASVDASKIFGRIWDAFGKEPYLLRPPPGELQASFAQGLAILVMLGSEPVGYARLIRLTGPDSKSGEWYEIGSVWVSPLHRHHKLGTRMHERLKLVHKGKNIFATSTNPLYVALVEKLGFVKIPRMSLPPDVWMESCICPAKKTGAENASGCRLAFGESQQSAKEPCFFMVEGDTARRWELA